MALPAVVPLVHNLYSSPAGKAALVALAPFLLCAAAIAFGAVELEQVTEKVSCVMSCQCARSYAIGGVLLWIGAMQAALKSGTKSLPKSDESISPPMPELDSKGKVAAKAA